MISAISNFRGQNLTFKSKQKEDDNGFVVDTLLDNNINTRTRIRVEKFKNSITQYPYNGLRGSINANFYEFLSMGTIPYLVGSATLMSVFNLANKHFHKFSESAASKLGNKMALGVLFYGVFKELAKPLISYPVKWKTGIDTELPYAKVNYLLQESLDKKNKLTSTEYHKVGESVDFPRWDLLYGKPELNEPLNFRYDKIAKKNGLGENLNDSDQDVKPIYKEVLVKSKLAQSFASFMWAATGVVLAVQAPWDNYFKSATLKFWKGKDFIHSVKSFGQSFVDSAKELYIGPKGNVSKFEKHAGKMILGAAILTTVLGILNTLHITQKPQLKPNNVINPNKESVGC